MTGSRLLRAGVGLFAALVLLTGCGVGIPQDLRQSLTVVVPHAVDFDDLDYYASRARAAYTSPGEIRRQFGDVTRVATVEPVDVQYFLETDHAARTQTIAIRGTSNRENFWQDVAITLVENSTLGMHVHKGFDRDTRQVRDDIRPHLKRDYTQRVTGHSLGGAIAMLLAAYLIEEGYTVDHLVTFGQPKITNVDGASLFEPTRTLRVVNDQDVVPMLPPIRLSQLFGGGYEHIGPEIILRPGRDYVYLPAHQADRLSVGEFWRNLGHFSIKEHSMKDGYLANIDLKREEGARQIPYFVSVRRVSASLSSGN